MDTKLDKQQRIRTPPQGKSFDMPESESFKTKQTAMLGKSGGKPSRPLGRARIEKIIEATIELLREHNPKDITITLVASQANIKRTSIYPHFKNVAEILEHISKCFVEQSGLYIEQYVRDHKPQTLSELLTVAIDGVYHHFNQSAEESLTSFAYHIPFEALAAVKDRDKISAMLYRSFWTPDWPVEPLSPKDPFCILQRLQEAVFTASIQAHGRITEGFSDLTKAVALDFMAGVERRFRLKQLQGSEADINTRLAAAIGRLSTASDPTFFNIAVLQIEILADQAIQ